MDYSSNKSEFIVLKQAYKKIWMKIGMNLGYANFLNSYNARDPQLR